MTDHLSPAERSRHMGRIRGQNTAPEKHLRQLLHRKGFRFRLHGRGLPGRPDLVLVRYNAAIFVHGCFWHRHTGCAIAYEPRSRLEFWTRKFEENMERDKRNVAALQGAGWRVAIVWECELRKPQAREHAAESVAAWLRSRRTHIEIPAKPRGRRRGH
jgi:DNA mismatch endonuclease, patch repair protein